MILNSPDTRKPAAEFFNSATGPLSKLVGQQGDRVQGGTLLGHLQVQVGLHGALGNGGIAHRADLSAPDVFLANIPIFFRDKDN